MTLFPLSLLLLKYNRGRLKRGRQTALFTIFFAFVIIVVAVAGNIAVNPKTFGYDLFRYAEFAGQLTWLLRYFSAYFIGITFIFFMTQNKTTILRLLYWTYDQYPLLHRWKKTGQWGSSLVGAIRHLKTQTVCVLVDCDEASRDI
jgi:hypothetical protein